MRKNRLVIMTLMILALFVFPIFAETEEENLEDMPTTVDETTTENEPEPTMPVIKKESTYFGVVDIWGGYTTLSFSSVNSYLAEKGAFVNGTTTEIIGGYVLGMDLGFTLIKDLPLALGLRIELIGAGQGKYTGDDILLNSRNLTFDASLIPVMAGASYTLEIPDSPIAVSADLYAGYSFARVTVSDNAKSLGTGETATSNYSGSAFAMDLGATVSYQINEPMSAGLTFGYRIANVAKMTADADVNNGIYDVTKGAALQDAGSNDVPLNFSGLNIGVNVDMKY